MLVELENRLIVVLPPNVFIFFHLWTSLYLCYITLIYNAENGLTSLCPQQCLIHLMWD